jgi:hypothetical protein
MKKLVVALVVSLMLVFANSMVASAESLLKVYYDPTGTLSMSGISRNTDGGFSVGYEYLTGDEQYAYGIGVEYDLSRKVTEATVGIAWLPIYALAQYKFDQFYLTGRFGYDLCMPEQLSSGVTSYGGVYFGFGFGYTVSENFVLETDYSFLNGGLTDGYYSANLSYSKLSIGAGIKF